MRFRMVTVSVVAVLAAAGLAACSSSSGGKGSTVSAPKVASGGAGSSSAPASTPASVAGSGAASGGGSVSDAAFCGQLAKVGEQFNSLSADASDPAKLKALLDTEATFLNNLKKGAPAEVLPTLDDLTTLLKEAEGAFANPNSPDLAKLQALATKLPADAQKLEAYLTAKCGGG